MTKVIHTNQAPTPVGAYSQAIRAGATLYCSGQIALNPTTGELVSGDIAAQTRRVLENLCAVLAAEGMSLANVVRATVFLGDMSDYAAMNQTYASFFADRPPARTTIATSGLPRGALIEIDVIAVAE